MKIRPIASSVYLLYSSFDFNRRGGKWKAFNPVENVSSRAFMASCMSATKEDGINSYEEGELNAGSVEQKEDPRFDLQTVVTVQEKTQSSPVGFLDWLASGLPAQSIILLNLVAILWGTQHAVIKGVLADSDPGAFTLLRFGIAALLASPYTPGMSSIWKSASDEEDTSSTAATTWRWGAEMGFWMFLGFSFQAIGLEYTTAQKSGFLLYLNVKFVPFLARILLGRNISAATWASALVAFSGTALLALSGTEGSADLNIGDAWSIAAAVASAMFILRLERASVVVRDAAGLNSACLWVVTLLAGTWTIAQEGGSFVENNPLGEAFDIARAHPLEMAYLSGVATAFANWIQAKAQRDVSAERASVIYAMDPVYGAFFSYLLLGEELIGIQGWIGAGLITAAAASNAFLDLSRKDAESPLLTKQTDSTDKE